MSPRAEYRPRACRALDPWEIGPFQLKVYHIGTEQPSEALLDAARVEAARIEGEAEAEGAHEGLGFVVLHEGEAGIWLLLCWWAHGDILCERLSFAADAGAAFERRDGRPLVACVWELPFLAHEREAWVWHMMREPISPEDYMDDRRIEATV